MKKQMSKIFIIATIVLGSTSAMASNLNTMCSVLNEVLPGKVTLTTGSTEVSGYEGTQNAQITSLKNGVLKIKSKEGTSIVNLVSVGAGESSTCLLAFDNDGIQGKLVDMDQDMKNFTFEEAKRGVRLVITKK